MTNSLHCRSRIERHAALRDLEAAARARTEGMTYEQVKSDLRDILAEAVRNTAALPVDGRESRA